MSMSETGESNLTPGTVRPFPRARAVERAWNEFVRDHPGGWWFHTSWWIDYALAYTPGAVDRSGFALRMEDNLIVCVAPGVEAPDGSLVFGGRDQPAPLAADQYFAAGGLLVLANRPGQRVQFHPGVPCTLPMEENLEVVRADTFVVDLAQPAEYQFTQLRKSYRQLINAAEDRFRFGVLDGTMTPEEADYGMSVAHQLHRASAGRETRPQATWDLQRDWLLGGFSVLALAFEGDTPVGFAYTLRWKGWSYYMSGAYSVPDVSHALVWHTMRALQAAGGTRWFEVGHDATPEDDEKARGIAFFKSGFGGAKWTYETVVGR